MSVLEIFLWILAGFVISIGVAQVNPFKDDEEM